MILNVIRFSLEPGPLDGKVIVARSWVKVAAQQSKSLSKWQHGKDVPHV